MNQHNRFCMTHVLWDPMVKKGGATVFLATVCIFHTIEPNFDYCTITMGYTLILVLIAMQNKTAGFIYDHFACTCMFTDLWNSLQELHMTTLTLCSLTCETDSRCYLWPPWLYVHWLVKQTTGIICDHLNSLCSLTCETDSRSYLWPPWNVHWLVKQTTGVI